MAADIKIKQTTVNAPTASTGLPYTQDITISGFGTPKAAIVLATRATAQDTITNEIDMSIGMYDGSTQWSMAIGNLNSSGNEAGCGVVSNSKILQLPKTNLSDNTHEATVAFITDGIRLTWTKVHASFNNAYLITVILFGGIDLLAKTGLPKLGFSDTTTSVSLDFTPKLVFLGSIGKPSLNTVSSSNNLISLSLLLNSVVDEQINTFHATASNQLRQATYTDKAGSSLNVSSLIYDVESVFNDNGFTLTPHSYQTTPQLTDTDDYWGYLALGGNFEAEIGITNSPVVSGTQDITTGWTPIAAGIILNKVTVTDTIETGSMSLSIGVATSADSAQSGKIIGSKYAASPIMKRNYSSPSKIVSVFNDATDAIVGHANVQSWLSTGFRLNWPISHSVAYPMLWWAIKSGGANSQSVSGTAGTLTGTLLKNTKKSVVGTSGTVSGSVAKTFIRTLTGAAGTLSGSLVKNTLKALSGVAGTLTGTGVGLKLATQYAQAVSGTMGALTGTVTAVQVFTQAVSGAISSITGVVYKQTNRTIIGVAGAVSGTISRVINKALSGAISPVATTTAGLIGQIRRGRLRIVAKPKKQVVIIKKPKTGA